MLLDLTDALRGEMELVRDLVEGVRLAVEPEWLTTISRSRARSSATAARTAAARAASSASSTGSGAVESGKQVDELGAAFVAADRLVERGGRQRRPLGESDGVDVEACGERDLRAVGVRPSLASRAADARRVASCLATSRLGSRIVRESFVSARRIACRIHQAA